jgi:hypothetical protein
MGLGSTRAAQSRDAPSMLSATAAVRSGFSKSILSQAETYRGVGRAVDVRRFSDVIPGREQQSCEASPESITPVGV